MHSKSTLKWNTEDVLTSGTTKPPTEHLTVELNTKSTASISQSSFVRITGSTNATSPQVLSSSKSSHSNGSVKGDLNSTEIISVWIVGALVSSVLIAVVVLAIYKQKRKSRSNVRTVRSNTQMSFDNLSYAEERSGRGNSEFVDMTDFELMRSNFLSSIKRKVSVFSNSASKEQEQENNTTISCGRLSIVETSETTSVDIGEIVQTFQV